MANEKANTLSGFSAGANIGHQLGDRYVSDMGLHVNYNYFIDSDVFVGGSFDINHANHSKLFKIREELQLTGRNKAYHEFRSVVLTHLNYSEHLTLRVGRMMSDNVAVDMNLALVRSNFRNKESKYSEAVYIKGVRTAGCARLSEKFSDAQRFGLAPGVSITYILSPNFSTSLNYRYDIFPGKIDNSRPKIAIHNVFVKFSYHI